jgi:GH25 family lysozyme M1 (1,4-beta-N-acetylmuramidase)
MSVYLPSVMSDVVVDLSHWQAPVDFVKAKAAGIAAVILKATEGVDFVDPTFAVRRVTAAASGLLVGAYHFFDTADPIAQAAFFMEYAGAVPLLALDFEPSPMSVTSQNRAAVFVTTVRARLGRWPLLYTGRWQVAPANPNFSQCPLWLAEYGSKPVCPPGWSKWTLWQHTDGRVGSAPRPVPGIGPCDRSRFDGTVAALASWWNTHD